MVKIPVIHEEKTVLHFFVNDTNTDLSEDTIDNKKLWESLVKLVVDATGSQATSFTLHCDDGSSITCATDLNKVLSSECKVFVRDKKTEGEGSTSSGGDTLTSKYTSASSKTSSNMVNACIPPPSTISNSTNSKNKDDSNTNAVKQTILQGDIVRRKVPKTGFDAKCNIGWVCCVPAEERDGHTVAHVYWQNDATENGRHEKIEDLIVEDRTLLPSEIVRLVKDGKTGSSGIVLDASMKIDLRQCMVNTKGWKQKFVKNVDAKRLPHFDPYQQSAMVVREGWFGRVKSSDYSFVVRFPDGARCQIPSSKNLKEIVPIEDAVAQFYPQLKVIVNTIKPEEYFNDKKNCTWLDDAKYDSKEHVEGVVESVQIEKVEITWLTQVHPMEGPYFTKTPESHCYKHNLDSLKLLTASSHTWWRLSDRTLYNEDITDVTKWKRSDWISPASGSNENIYEVEALRTTVDVQWQDGTLQKNIPTPELVLCNPDPHSFFPQEIVVKKDEDDDSDSDDECFEQTICKPVNPSSNTTTTINTITDDAARATQLEKCSNMNGDDLDARWGYVVSMDPKSRMVKVCWYDEVGVEAESIPSFELQADGNYGHRVGDAVMLLDAIAPIPSSPNASPSKSDNNTNGNNTIDTKKEGRGDEGDTKKEDEPEKEEFVNVGQVIEMKNGLVKVQWLNGTISKHAPPVLYRVADEDDGFSDDGSESDWEDFPESIKITTPRKIELESSNDFAELKKFFEGEKKESENVKPKDEKIKEDTSTSEEEKSEEDDDDEDDDEDDRMDKMTQESAPSDHQYLSNKESQGKRPISWTKKVNKEWQNLATSLPPDVFVHVYEDRMDIMRAVLTGPSGTPYADALFFFDIHLPADYPNGPPNVKFWSFGKTLNPNLYENGKVCLSLLGTWSGSENESWQKNSSNVLQVLISILGLVMVSQPYYNEPGFEREKGTEEGEARARQYNESVRLNALETIVTVLRKPPTGFEDYVKEHYTARKDTILKHVDRLLEGKGADPSESNAPTASPMRGIEEERSLDGVEANSSEAFKMSLRKVKIKLEAAFKTYLTKTVDMNSVD